MTDNKERTIKDILNDEIERKLAENPPKMPTLEEFKAMAYERLEEKDAENTEAETDTEVRTIVANTKTDKKRKLYIACGAAGFVIAVMICAFAINMFTTDVGADKNPKDEIITEDGVIIEDGGWGSSEGEDNVFVVTDWEHIKATRELYPELLTPTYIPSEYKFQQMRAETYDTGDAIFEYIYTQGNEEIIEIEEFYIVGGSASHSIDGEAKKLTSSKGTIYVQENGKKATIFINGGITISIWSILSDEEIIKIAEGLV